VLASRYNDGDQSDTEEVDESLKTYIRAHTHAEIADLLEKAYLPE
jgi:hypothetical protein